MNDNFDLRKFLVESKAIENMNPIFRQLNENTETSTETTTTEATTTETTTTETTTTINENNLRNKIREMVLAELGGVNEMEMEVEEDELYEAKKDEAEDVPAEDAELDVTADAEMDAPEAELSAAAAGATGDAKELINHLMTSLDTAKSMGNEKLTTQILNTLKFAIDQSMAQ